MNIPGIGIAIMMLIFLNSSTAQEVDFIKGADGSLVQQVEDAGGKFYVNGAEADVLQVFKNNGINTIRLKIWHTPEDQYNSLTKVVEMARRAKAMGFLFMLDFHYSDTWADPGKQFKPAAWEGLSFDLLADSIKAYTKQVITTLKYENALPDMVQIGNEITCGMLWDEGRICDPWDTPQQWNQLGKLIKSAVQGLNESLDAGEEVKVILHFDNGTSINGCRWWFDNITGQGVEFDIIGLSFYPWWHGTLTGLRNNLNDLSNRYGKDILVVETGYPWTLGWNDNMHNLVGLPEQLHEGYPATVEGQAKFLRDLMNTISETIENRGKGFIYWSPEYITAPRQESPWENIALFDFDGEVLESIRAFDEKPGYEEGIRIKPFKLHPLLPNPFRSGTRISFEITTPSAVEMSIFDAFGKRITTLVKEQHVGIGNNSVYWNAENIKPGIYYLYFMGDDFVEVRKIVKQ